MNHPWFSSSGRDILNGTTGAVPFVGSDGRLLTDPTAFIYKLDLDWLGLGTNDPQGPLHCYKDYSGGTLSSIIENINGGASAACSWLAKNDSARTIEIGIGSSGRSDLLDNAGFIYNSAGGIHLISGDSSAQKWLFGGVSSGNVAMSLVSTGLLTIGLAGSLLGSLGLAGNTSGLVTIRPAAAAGTWTLTLPTDDGTDGQFLKTNGAGVTSWADASGGGMAIGGAITSATAGSLLFVDGSAQLAQDNSNLFWDNTAKSLGIGKNSGLSAAVPLDVLKSASSATVYGNVKNSDSTGAAGWRGTNDSDHFVEYGMGGTGRSDEFDDAGYFYSSAGGIKFATGSSHGFKWLVNGVSSAVVKMILNSSGQLGVGVAPNTILSLFESNSGATTSATVRNDSSSGAASWSALNDSSHAMEFGIGGSARGDGLQDRGFIYSAQGIRVFTTSSQPVSFCINGIADTDRALEIDGSKNVVLGDGALSTSATDGFLYVPTCAGAPSGTPTSKTGRAPIVVDTSNGRLYAYYGSAWHLAALI